MGLGREEGIVNAGWCGAPLPAWLAPLLAWALAWLMGFFMPPEGMSEEYFMLSGWYGRSWLWKGKRVRIRMRLISAVGMGDWVVNEGSRRTVARLYIHCL